MIGGNLNPAPAAAGAVAFRRSYGGILSRSSRWLSFGILALIGGFGLAVMLLPSPPGRAASTHLSRSAFDFPIMTACVIALLVGYLLSRCYERLYVSPTGIRYTSWLGGPFAFLSSVAPSWELNWDDLADIRLVKSQYSRGGMTWFYLFVPKAAQQRRVLTYWRSVDAEPEDLGLTLWQVFTKDVPAYERAIAGSQLFRLLDLTMRTRKEQFKHALVEDQ